LFRPSFDEILVVLRVDVAHELESRGFKRWPTKNPQLDINAAEPLDEVNGAARTVLQSRRSQSVKRAGYLNRKVIF
jgi:hypothetical protein